MASAAEVQANGRVALVTGASSGIGRVTARALALQGYHVILACRSESRTVPVLREIASLSSGRAKAEFAALDLGNLESVRRCAATFLSRQLPLHLLVANAGLAGQRGLTQSGFELAFGTCHIGHFLLQQLLEPTLIASAPSRVVVVASKAHRHARGIDFADVRRTTETKTGLREYGVAKLANVLFAAELGRRLRGTGVTTYALHPGVVGTEVWRSIPWPLDRVLKTFMLSAEAGAKTSLYCATNPTLGMETGGYYDECKAAEPSELAKDTALADRLWRKSEAWIAL